MYVIIPCITGASKPNERLYKNDRLHMDWQCKQKLRGLRT